MAQLRVDNSYQAQAAESMPLPPPAIHKLVHDIISNNAIASPNAQAIASASINFNYQDLDQASSWLASRIISLGIGNDSIVPIICEKV